MRIKLLLITILLLSTASVCVAQTGIPSEGREFFIGLVYPSFLRAYITPLFNFIPDYTASVVLSSEVKTTVYLSYFDQGGQEVGGNTVQLLPHDGKMVSLDVTKFNTSNTNGESVVYGTCHIVSSSPISVQFLSIGSCSGGSYLSLPIQCWGKQYVVQSYNDNPSAFGGYVSTESSRGFFQILAAEDGTQVTITSSTTTAGGHQGAISGNGATGSPQPFLVSLGRGECYTVYSEGTSADNDITGSVITSNKPIGVLSGQENAYPSGSMDPISEVEGRDYMVEELTPVESWDSTGYFTIPFIDGTPTTSQGFGDEIRAVAMPNAGNLVLYQSGGSSNSISMSPYEPFPELGVALPTGFSDVNKKPFSVMQYDQRMQGEQPPYPAPSMSSVIPKSRWKSEYFFYVPNLPSLNRNYQQYLYLIIPRSDWNNQKIFMSRNGATLEPIGASIKKMWNTMPGDPNVVGMALYLGSTGSYYLIDKGILPADSTRHSTFAASYNASTIQGNYTTYGGPPTYTDMDIEFANPLGMNYGQFGTVVPKFSSTITNNCGTWTACIRDSGDTKTGIRYIELINYPKGSYVQPIPSSYNVAFDPSVDPLTKGEIILPGTDTSYCFTVSPVNPADSVVAVVEIYDNSGASTLINLSAKTTVKAAASGALTPRTSNSFNYPTISVDSSVCGVVSISNPAGNGAKDFVIDSISLKGDSSEFSLTGSFGTFPIRVHPGDVEDIPVCFSPDDTATFASSIVVTSECSQSFSYQLSGKGASGLINASDATFIGIDSGFSGCDTIAIKNTGTLPIVLEQYPVLTDSINFKINTAFLSTLPLSIAPGASINAIVCFTPKDRNSHTATIIWKTNIRQTAALETRVKSKSVLNGIGHSPSITWSPQSLSFVADTTISPIRAQQRIYLVNREAAKQIDVANISITGQDSAEFVITNSQYNSLSNFVIDGGDSTWLDIQFLLDTTKPPSVKYADRNAYLICNYTVETSGSGGTAETSLSVSFVGSSSVDEANSFSANMSLVASLQNRHLSIHLAPFISIPFDCKLYDLLGREVASWDNIVQTNSNSSTMLITPILPSGAYILRIACGTIEKECVVICMN